MDESRAQDWRKRFQIEIYSPEEWAARYAHNLLVFSNRVRRDQDPELHDWLEQLIEIMSDQARLDSLRHQYLSAAEIAAINEQLEECERVWDRQFAACERLERIKGLRAESSP